MSSRINFLTEIFRDPDSRFLPLLRKTKTSLRLGQTKNLPQGRFLILVLTHKILLNFCASPTRAVEHTADLDPYRISTPIGFFLHPEARKNTQSGFEPFTEAPRASVGGHSASLHVRPEGLEPSTLGLRVPCSTN